MADIIGCYGHVELVDGKTAVFFKRGSSYADHFLDRVKENGYRALLFPDVSELIEKSNRVDVGKIRDSDHDTDETVVVVRNEKTGRRHRVGAI